jgi:Na+/proline symporter
MELHPIDLAIIALYALFALGVGLVLRRRASGSMESFFLSERSLPWWLTGTSMIATSFAADTPLVVTGWVREHGVWKNWLWWCYAFSGVIGVFFFARLWRRSLVLTKAELVELRYGGRGAAALRFSLGVVHSGVTNVMVLCWVLLAAAKIMDSLFGVDRIVALGLASGTALTYSLLAGLWGVVITDLVQLAMASVGALALAFASWSAVGGRSGLSAGLAEAGSRVPPEVMSFLPSLGDANLLSPTTWTPAVAAIAVYLGVAWWAVENVDGSGIAVQRLAASRDERHGVLAFLWFNVGHYAMRPWPWIVVALASLIVLPTQTVTAPIDGQVASVRAGRIVLDGAEGERVVPWPEPHADAGWRPVAQVRVGDAVSAGDVLAETDSEMGLLGITIASLFAAFMSTIDTHMNLASSFFVNDVYRRFVRPGRRERHYVTVARIASATVLAVGMLVAWQADSISGLFLFFLSFLAGIGPVNVLRWFWWRITAWTEISALLASGVATVALTRWPDLVSLGPLSSGGNLAPEGRLLLVVTFAFGTAMLVTFAAGAPRPEELVPFYERVRPSGAWGPVRRLTDVRPQPGVWRPAAVGTLSSTLLIFGLLVAIGRWVLGGASEAVPAAAVALVGAIGTGWALASIRADVRSPENVARSG